MNIALANQKGGVGKTTLTILLAEYLQRKDLKPVCLDFDNQGSLYQRWNVAADLLDSDPPHYVVQCDLDSCKDILEETKNTDQEIIFDLPGSLDHPSIQMVLEEMDLIICPFLYEPISFESTFFFAQVIKELKMKANTVFVPNMVKSSVKYEIKKKVTEELTQYGDMAPEINDLVNMQRIDFFNITEKSLLTVDKAFNYFTKKYIIF